MSLDDVRRIADFHDLSPKPQLDAHKPISDHTYDAQFPSQCQVAFDQDVTFGNGWTQFRTVDYSGASNYGVTQAVAVYPDDDAARAALNRVASALIGCSALHDQHFQFTVNSQDPSTVALCYPPCSEFYRVKSSVLIDVAAQNFPDAERIASTVLQTITDRIPGM